MSSQPRLRPSVAGLAALCSIVDTGPNWSVALTATLAGRAGGSDEGDVRALVDRARGGDGDAFGALYDHYVDMVYRYVYYRVGTRALTEDLVSDTFLRAIRRIGSFRWQGADFGAWLTTIARNLIADHFKSSRYKLEVPTAELLDSALSAEPGADTVVLDREATGRLLDAVRRLPGVQQECVVLRFLQGLSVAETAAVMGRSDGAVKALQYRATRSLAGLLTEGGTP